MTVYRDGIAEAIEEVAFKARSASSVGEVRENLLYLVDKLYCESWIGEEEDDEG
jgi:hypothetical protein